MSHSIRAPRTNHTSIRTVAAAGRGALVKATTDSFSRGHAVNAEGRKPYLLSMADA